MVGLSLFPDRRLIPIVLAVASLTFDVLMMQELYLDQVTTESRHLIEEALPSARASWHYLDHLPAPGQPWPATVSAIFGAAISSSASSSAGVATADTSTLTLTTGIPALYRNVEEQLPNVLRSIASQTVLPEEVVIVISEVVSSDLPDGTALCQSIYTWMQMLLNWQSGNRKALIQPRLLCVGERLTAGRARNAVGKLASSDIVSFIDADDLELPLRNAVTKYHFACHPELQMVLHQYTKDPEELALAQQQQQPQTQLLLQELAACPPHHFGNNVAMGSRLYDMLQETHERWWLRKEMAHGHMVVRRTVLEQFQFSSMYKGEDAAFIRDVLFAYGRNDEAAVYLKRPLTSYFQSNQANRDLLKK